MKRQPKILKTIESALEARGERFTEPRKRVMAALLDAKTPQTAYELVNTLEGMKPMSVYRSLDFLSGAGLIHRIESLNAYISCAENHCAHRDSQYLVCRNCRNVTELHNHDIDNFIQKNLKKSGFKIEYKTLELHGLCANCA